MITDLIPKDKGDTETAEQLKNYSFEDIEPIIPDLLEWLQDMNWPVARPISEYLVSVADKITSHILAVLQDDDELWKYWMVVVFGNASERPDDLLMNEFKRMANHPTQSEIRDEVNEVALDVLKRWNES